MGPGTRFLEALTTIPVQPTRATAAMMISRYTVWFYLKHVLEDRVSRGQDDTLQLSDLSPASARRGDGAAGSRRAVRAARTMWRSGDLL